jgi:hypothetical protein
MQVRITKITLKGGRGGDKKILDNAGRMARSRSEAVMTKAKTRSGWSAKLAGDCGHAAS